MGILLLLFSFINFLTNFLLGVVIHGCCNNSLALGLFAGSFVKHFNKKFFRWSLMPVGRGGQSSVTILNIAAIGSNS